MSRSIRRKDFYRVTNEPLGPSGKFASGSKKKTCKLCGDDFWTNSGSGGHNAEYCLTCRDVAIERNAAKSREAYRLRRFRERLQKEASQ